MHSHTHTQTHIISIWQVKTRNIYSYYLCRKVCVMLYTKEKKKLSKYHIFQNEWNEIVPVRRCAMIVCVLSLSKLLSHSYHRETFYRFNTHFVLGEFIRHTRAAKLLMVFLSACGKQFFFVISFTKICIVHVREPQTVFYILLPKAYVIEEIRNISYLRYMYTKGGGCMFFRLYVFNRAHTWWEKRKLMRERMENASVWCFARQMIYMCHSKAFVRIWGENKQNLQVNLILKVEQMFFFSVN